MTVKIHFMKYKNDIAYFVIRCDQKRKYNIMIQGDDRNKTGLNKLRGVNRQ